MMFSEKSGQNNRYDYRLGHFKNEAEKLLDQWKQNGFLKRLWGKDWKLWFPQKKPEITNRLGWLRLHETMPPRLAEFRSLAESVKKTGIKKIILLGMGGSSLAPEVFQETFSSAPGYPECMVLDSTHPESVIRTARELDYSKTFFVVSSKSGTTLETLSFFQYFWEKCRQKINRPGDRFAVITDSGSPLESIGREKGFKHISLPPEDVGGRYSALTDFGLLPGALMGMDLDRLLEQARAASRNNAADADPERAPGIALGAALGGAGRHCDKITVWASSSLAHFPDWLEQLIAESTGKSGKGLIPVVNEPAMDPERYSRDRFFVLFQDEKDADKDQTQLFNRLTQAGHPGVHITVRDKYELGQEIFNWELGIAAAGAALGIHPFNQPDVQLAKDLAKKAMQEPGEVTSRRSEKEHSIRSPSSLKPAMDHWLSQVKKGDYLGIQAFLPDNPDTSVQLRALREKLLDAAGIPVTLGFGPRFLHSTGQLHKGGPNSGLFLQLVDQPQTDLDVPGSGYSFGQLIRAQAVGDFRALIERKRRVLRINLQDMGPDGIERISDFVQD